MKTKYHITRIFMLFSLIIPGYNIITYCILHRDTRKEHHGILSILGWIYNSTSNGIIINNIFSGLHPTLSKKIRYVPYSSEAPYHELQFTSYPSVGSLISLAFLCLALCTNKTVVIVPLHHQTLHWGLYRK